MVAFDTHDALQVFATVTLSPYPKQPSNDANTEVDIHPGFPGQGWRS